MNIVDFVLSQGALHVPIYYSVAMRRSLGFRMNKLVLQQNLFNNIAAYFSNYGVKIVAGVTFILWQPKTYVVRTRRVYTDGLYKII